MLLECSKHILLAPPASFCKRARVRIWPEFTTLRQHPVVAQYAGMQAQSGRETLTMCNLSQSKTHDSIQDHQRCIKMPKNYCISFTIFTCGSVHTSLAYSMKRVVFIASISVVSGVRSWVPKSKIWALKKALKKVLFWVSVKKSAQKSAQKSTQIKKYSKKYSKKCPKKLFSSKKCSKKEGTQKS